jgi:hypothetical protein
MTGWATCAGCTGAAAAGFAPVAAGCCAEDGVASVNIASEAIMDAARNKDVFISYTSAQ